MIQFIWIAVLWTACNNTASTGESNNRLAATLTEEKPAAGPVACNKLIFFKPGAIIKTKSYDANGKEMGSQQTNALQVKNEGGMTVAYVEASDTSRVNNHTTTRQYNYKCDGKTIYFDLASVLRATAQERDATIEASMIEYPIAVTAGTSLPDANGTMVMTKAGKKMTMKYT